MQTDPIYVNGVTIYYDDFVDALWKEEEMDAMIRHAAMGVAGEAGELVDCLKKVSVYGKELDRENLVEELGDIMFYLTCIMNLFSIMERECILANVRKLEKRYKGLQYSNKAAIDRADKKETGEIDEA